MALLSHLTVDRSKHSQLYVHKISTLLENNTFCLTVPRADVFSAGGGGRLTRVCVCTAVRVWSRRERARERIPGWRRHRERGARLGTARHGSMASSRGRSDLRFADWMSSLPQSMHSIPLTNLAIPGRCSPPRAQELSLSG